MTWKILYENTSDYRFLRIELTKLLFACCIIIKTTHYE